MKELSVFIDESGDFGEYDFHSPYYIITMIFHDQNRDISREIDHLNQQLNDIGLREHAIHTGPIIRKEEDYKYMSIDERRRILNKMTAFIKSIEIEYSCFYIEKKHVADVVETSGKLSKQIGDFIRQNYDWLMSYDVIKVYYDNGQIELNKVLSSVFNVLLSHVEFKRVLPKDYKLFQAADLLCTFKLIDLKLQNEGLSKSELVFFGNSRDLKRNYLKPLRKLEHHDK